MMRFVANALWFLSCLPGWVAFRIAARNPEKAQRRVLRKLLRENRDSEFGQKHGFAKIRTEAEFAAAAPLAEYGDFAEAIAAMMRGRVRTLTREAPFLLEPTSGSTGASKFIPQTRALRGEFARAIAPWIASLYIRNPALFFGRQYWAISPTTRTDFPESAVPIGFSDDAEYLGAVGRLVCGKVMTLTPDAENVRLVSVWHPSFLTARENARPLPRSVRVLSAWDGVTARPHLERLRGQLPAARFQAKGLLATEGIVSFPFGMDGMKPLAIRSHFLEFVDAETEKTCGVAGLKKGRAYSVVLSTGGGLWRYRLHDVVRVTGFFRKTPCVEFIGKDNAVSDLVGEKLAEQHCAEALESALVETGIRPLFAMLVPEKNASGYVLRVEFSEPSEELAQRWAMIVERQLRKNYHYHHAREIGQLAPLRAEQVKNGAEEFLREAQSGECRAGTFKIPVLDVRTKRV